MKELKDFSEVELKAASYDQLANIERCQENIKAINQELTRRSQAPVEEKKEDVDTN
jgi:hypothetical protein